MARNSIILNGKSSNTITGLIIQELPPISKPLMRSQVEEIDGRDGDIITKLGFSAYDKEISVGLYGNFDINEIIAYFNSEGTVTFSNEPDKFYYYQILDQIDFERLVRFRTATINFHVQPFKYSTTEEAETIEAGTVSGEGNNIVLENTSDNPFSKLTPKGDTFQQTYSGKNLFSGNWSQFDNAGGTGTTYAYFKLPDDGDYYLTIIAKNDISVQSPGKFFGFTSNGGDSSGVLWAWSGNSTATAGHSITIYNKASSINRQFLSMYPKNAATLQWFVDNFDIQLEKGSATAYEPYVGGTASPNPDYPQDIQVVTGEQTVKVTGKNLFDITTLATDNITVIDGVATGTAAQFNTTFGANTSGIMPPPSGQATISLKAYTDGNGSSSNVSGLIIRVIYDDSTNDTITWNNNQLSPLKKTLSTNANKTISKIIISYQNTGSNIWHLSEFQIEIGQPTTYEPYQSQTFPISLGSIELAKIGTYQDYIYKSNGNWYKHAEVGKVLLDGTETWGVQVGLSYYTSVADIRRAPNVDTVANIKSNYYTVSAFSAIAAGTVDYAIASGVSNSRIIIRNKDCADATAMQTWLSAHNTTVYYALATPTDTAIADETLLGQLDDLAEAHAYKGRTHIISTAGSDANLPQIIEAKVLGSSDATITNAGNFISKPKFTIYGSGNIGLYINGIQILQIALGDEQYITIDAAQMEAYKDTLDNLKNRLVTGDYTNLALNPGENQISFSGSVEKYIVENYSRWL